jgi:hypothetical protein
MILFYKLRPEMFPYGRIFCGHHNSQAGYAEASIRILSVGGHQFLRHNMFISIAL